MRVLSGGLRGLRWIAGSATHGCWIGSYERDAQRIFARHVRPGDVVWDIGANVGFFTLLASRLVGDGGAVYAFEPLPRNLHYLGAHIELNDIRNVHIKEIALSDRKGTARFMLATNPAMGGVSEKGDLEVQTDTIDGLTSLGSVQVPSFIKMDIEGGESAALSGGMALLREIRPAILLSAHGHVQNDRCANLLRGLGYRIEILRNGALDGNYVFLAVA